MPLAKQPTHNSELNQTVLVIILPKKHIAKMEEQLDKLAASEWRTNQPIFLIEIPDQYIHSSRHIKASIKRQRDEFKLVGADQIVHYMISDDLNFDQQLATKSGIPDHAIERRSFKMIVELLGRRLKERGMCWLQVAEVEIRKWQFDTISAMEIVDWLKQFDQIGGDKHWVGERLLRNFKVWDVDQFTSALYEGDGSDVAGEQICIIRYENGKSSDSISTFLRKKLPALIGTGKIVEYRTFLETGDDIACLVFEDGVFTGIEISDLICSLVGEEGFKKCAPLNVPSRMKSSKTFIRFAIGTDIGLYRVKETIKQLGVAVEVSTHHEIKTLTDSGYANLIAGTLYTQDTDEKSVLRDAENDIIPQAFIDLGWGARRKEAMEFCRQLGLDLFTAYQIKKGKNWTSERLNDCALGAGNMALLFSFPHSLPKSTLPVFWCHGTILDQNGKNHVWLPLFQSAHRN